MAVQFARAPGAHGAAHGASGLEHADEEAEKPAHAEASPDVLLKGMVEAARVERQSIQVDGAGAPTDDASRGATEDESSCATTCSVEDDGSSSRMSTAPLHETDVGTSLPHLTGKRREEAEAQSEVRDQSPDVLGKSLLEMSEAQVGALLLCQGVLLAHTMEDLVTCAVFRFSYSFARRSRPAAWRSKSDLQEQVRRRHYSAAALPLLRLRVPFHPADDLTQVCD